MKIMTKSASALLMAAVLAFIGIGLAGCGGGVGDGDLWSEAASITSQHHAQMERASGAEARQIQSETAQRLEDAVDEHPRAPERLRRLLTNKAQELRQLANQEVSGAEAREMEERHQEYASHLQNRQVPPEYR